MPPVQTAYNDKLAEAFEGMIVNTEPNNLISREAEGPIAFGKAVQQGTADNQVLAADGAADVFRGVTVREYAQVNSALVAGDTALIMDRGVIWVLAGGTVTAGAAAHMVPATGRFVDAATSNLPIPNAVFDSSGGDGDLVKLRLK